MARTDPGRVPRIPLRRRTAVRLWILFLLLLSPILAHGVVVEVRSRNEQFQHALSTLRGQVDAAEHMKTVLFAATGGILRTLSQIDAVRGGDDGACSDVLARVAMQYEQYTAFTRVNAQELITCSSQPMERPVDVSGSFHLRAVSGSQGMTVSTVTEGAITGRPILVFSLPIPDGGAGIARATVNTGLDLTWFQAELAKVVPAGTAHLVLFDGRGAVVAQLPPAEAGPGMAVVDAPLRDLVRAKRQGSGEYVDPEGRVMVASFVTRDDVPGGLHVAASIPAEAIDSDLHRLLWDRLAVLAAVILLSMAVFWAAADVLLLRGVRSLIRQADRLAGGDLRARSTIPPTSAVELCQLAGAYDRMAEELQARERALADSEARLRLALAGAAMGSVDHNLRTGRMVRSPLVDEMFGFPADGSERPADDYLARVHPDDRGRITDTVRAAENGDSVVDIEYRVGLPDGSERWIAARGEILPGADGKPLRYLGVLRDVTEGRRIERALRESEERFRSMADSVPDILFIARSGGTCDYHNRRFCDLTGLPAEAGIGKGWVQVLHPDDRDRHLREWERADREESVFECECRLRMADGGYRWFVTRAIPVPGGQERPCRWMGAATDIDDRKRAEQALHTARLEAERANRAKSRFLAAASHDLRQPLNAISLFLGVLESHVDATGKTVLTQIQISLDAMIDLFNALLDLSKLESGAVQASVAPVPVTALFDRLRTDFEGLAREKGLELRVTPCRGVLLTDGPLLERILRNLISNAIRYTDEGRVVVGCRRRNGALRVDVLDTGPGIPAEDQRRIFEEFFQLANPARQRRAGHGLGLAIARRTADLMGLPLELDSAAGRGTRFSVTVPLADGPAQAAGGEAPAAAAPSSVRKRVWVIEDDPLVSAAMVLVLAELGCDVVSVDNADDAMMLTADAEPRPDLVISDYRLPGEADGVMVVRTVRERLGDGVATCIVTGDPTDDIELRARRAGARLLRKPIRSQDLVRLLENA